MNYFERVNNIYSNQKQGDIYYRYFTRYVSAPITALVSFTRLTPNMATLSMFFFGILGAIFFSFGSASDYMMGGLCFVFLIVADTVDGELARFHGTSSLFGDFFDRLAHYTTNPLMILGVGLGVYSTYQEIAIIYLSALVMVCYLVDDISRDLLISCGLADGNSRKEEKDSLSIHKGSRVKKAIYYTASNTAFFHLIILVAGLDILINKFSTLAIDLMIIHTYVAYFSIATVSKVFFRLPLIIALKDK